MDGSRSVLSLDILSQRELPLCLEPLVIMLSRDDELLPSSSVNVRLQDEEFRSWGISEEALSSIIVINWARSPSSSLRKRPRGASMILNKSLLLKAIKSALLFMSGGFGSQVQIVKARDLTPVPHRDRHKFRFKNFKRRLRCVPYPKQWTGIALSWERRKNCVCLVLRWRIFGSLTLGNLKYVRRLQ